MAGNPQCTVIAAVRYRDADAAIAWLEHALGFTVHAVYRDAAQRVAHAELAFTTDAGTGMVMLGEVHTGEAAAQVPAWSKQPAEANGVTAAFYLIVPDCRPAYAKAQAAGAELLMPLQRMDYGGDAFTVRDPDGFVWTVGEYNPWAPPSTAA